MADHERGPDEGDEQERERGARRLRAAPQPEDERRQEGASAVISAATCAGACSSKARRLNPAKPSATEVLQALGDPVRLEILSTLASGGERACGTLALPVSDSTRSHHLRVLRSAGVTATRVEGTRRTVSLGRDDLDARSRGCSTRSSSRHRAEPTR